MALKSNKTTAEAIAQLKALYREDQPTDFIAMEFMVSPEIRKSVQPGSLLWRAMQESEKGIPSEGFAWFGSDNNLSRLIEGTRAALQKVGPNNAEDVLSSLLTEDHPSYLQSGK